MSWAGNITTHVATERDSVAVKANFCPRFDRSHPRQRLRFGHGGVHQPADDRQRGFGNHPHQHHHGRTPHGGHAAHRPHFTDWLVLKMLLAHMASMPEKARIIHISDTLHLKEVLVSAVYQDQFAERGI